MDFQTWTAFFLAAWLICLSPGPGALKSMGTGLRWGFRKGWWNLLGLEAGAMVLLLTVSTGAGAVLVASPRAFQAMKWAGAGYLAWLGLRQFFSKSEAPGIRAPAQADARRLFWEAFLVNTTNPKGILFMLAVLPQFIDPMRALAPQYLACALTLLATDLIVMSGYTIFASRVLQLFQRPGQIRSMNRLFGALFVAAGAGLALYHRGG
ncbi:MAG: LysE family transporter [Spirochaetes bacterium]|nr:LysE family transporter [Spirochaetota bacterium]